MEKKLLLMAMLLIGGFSPLSAAIHTSSSQKNSNLKKAKEHICEACNALSASVVYAIITPLTFTNFYHRGEFVPFPNCIDEAAKNAVNSIAEGCCCIGNIALAIVSLARASGNGIRCCVHVARVAAKTASRWMQ